MRITRVFIGVLMLVGLAACGGQENGNGNGDTSPTVTPASGFNVTKSGVRVGLPSTWREIAASEYPSTVLSREPVAVFRRREADGGVFPNIVITRQTLGSDITPLEFSRATRENTSASLFDYEQLAVSERTLGAQQTAVVEFLARSAPDARRLRFWQVALTRPGTGFVITAAAATEPAETVTNEIRSVLNSIAFSE